MADRIFITGRIEAPDEASAKAIAERLASDWEITVRGPMLSIAAEGWGSYSSFEELFVSFRSIAARSRIGCVRGSIGDDEEDASTSTAEARGDGSLTRRAQQIANLAYARDHEQLQSVRCGAAEAPELVAVYLTLPDATSKALLVSAMFPHYDGARAILLDVLSLPADEVSDDSLALAWSAALAYLDGDLEAEATYFELPRDELERVARARAAHI